LFDDSSQHDPSWGPLVFITVRWGNCIDGIGLAYESGRSVFHGQQEAERTSFSLQPGEFVRAARVSYGKQRDLTVVTGLWFETNKGNTFGPVGRGGKSADMTGWHDVDFGGEALLYVFGRAGGYLDQIGFGYGPPPGPVERPVVRSTTCGGDGGTAFDDWQARDGALGKIRSITVGHGARIDAIEAAYQGSATVPSDDTPTASSLHHGGSGGEKSTFTLADDEYLERIEGYADGGRVNQLQFITSKGNHSPRYGDSTGKAFSLYTRDKVIVAFFGRSGNSLDQIGVFFADKHSAPQTIELSSITFDVGNGNVREREPRTFLSTLASNPSSTDQSLKVSVTREKSATSTLTIAQTHSASVSISRSVSVGINIEVIEASVATELTLGYAFEQTRTTEESNTKTESLVVELTQTVPAGRWARARMDVEWLEFDVPWTGTGKVTYMDGTSADVPLNGWFKGVASGQANVIWEDAPLGVPVDPRDWPHQPLYRLRNPGNNNHLFTLNGGERTQLVAGGWQDEGTTGRGWTEQYPGAAPIHRYYRDGLHAFARFDHEKSRLAQQGYAHEGVACHVLVTPETGAKQLYHLRHDACGHILTTNANEAEALTGGGWEKLWSPGWILVGNG